MPPSCWSYVQRKDTAGEETEPPSAVAARAPRRGLRPVQRAGRRRRAPPRGNVTRLSPLTASGAPAPAPSSEPCGLQPAQDDALGKRADARTTSSQPDEERSPAPE